MYSDKTIRDHFMFRVILQAMSRPGKVFSLPDYPERTTVSVELLSCLLDNEVGFAVIGDKDLEIVINRYTSSRPAPPENADYIIVCNGTTGGKLAGFKRGSLEYPDTGATILYLVEELSDTSGGIELSGPGIRDIASLRITGFNLNELRLLKQVNGEFPLGLDVIFLDRSGHIACIPRSSQIGVN